MKATKITQKSVYQRSGLEVEVNYVSPKLYKMGTTFYKCY